MKKLYIVEYANKKESILTDSADRAREIFKALYNVPATTIGYEMQLNGKLKKTERPVKIYVKESK